LRKQNVHIALVGNPNSGKTSLFNSLTGLNQKVGNFPGVTVDKKTGDCSISAQIHAHITDLPGTYSLYPRRADEWVAYKVLLQQDKDTRPDMVVLVADASNLKRNLLFASQILDLKIPVVVALTMMDLARKKGTQIDIDGLELELGVPVVAVNPRKEKGMAELKKAIELVATNNCPCPHYDFIDNKALASQPINDLDKLIPDLPPYKALHYLMHHESFDLPAQMQEQIEQCEVRHKFNHSKTQAAEVMQRYHRIGQVMHKNVVEADPLARKLKSDRLDNILLHRVWGYVIMLAVLFLLFQSIFWLAQYPMEGIDKAFSFIQHWLGSTLPEAWWSDLLVNGIVAGLGGIVIFIPQIMILFGLITLLEDSGYMARISFLTDKLMRKVGLNGKSVMPMISGFACAVPAIMSARNIENQKERLLTILITPLMSCSARLPVFTILIALIIPNTYYLGFLSLQGLIMMGLYIFGVVIALAVSWVAKWFINLKEKSFFILELPVYRPPRWKNAAITMVEKARIFVMEAGKIIMIISLVLWFLSSYGPGNRMQAVTERFEALIAQQPENEDELSKQQATQRLENSYAGIMGKAIEPAIKPLGYDWKIGIALITSFAAREVFVGTMATLYSVGDDADENDMTLREKMQAATWSDGSKVYTLATGMSLMVFYLLAMQCMSTLAIVKRETKSWKWPMIQLVYMTALAYVFSWIAFQIFS
jgi:ferrous iron transport protein B